MTIFKEDKHHEACPKYLFFPFFRKKIKIESIILNVKTIS